MIPRSRSGTAMVIEMTVICVGMVLSMTLIADGLYQRQAERRFDQRNAEWETAENILDALRQHVEPTLPSGWTVSREPVNDQCELVILDWPHGHLQTLRTTGKLP
jgi:hypothetical protein